MPKSPQPYQHHRFRSGLNVMIDPTILEHHPLSPLAGHIVRTCIGNVYEELVCEDQKALVPVLWNNQIFYVEEEYIYVD